MKRPDEVTLSREEGTLPASVFDFRLIPPFC